MNCKKCEKCFSAYIDNQLNNEQREQFERHLESCDHCTKEFVRFKKIVSLTTDLPEIKPSSIFDKVLYSKLADDETSVPFRPLKRRNFIYAFVAVCLFIAVAGVYVHNYLSHQQDRKQMMAGRKYIPIIPSNTNDNVLTHVLMPNVPTIRVSIPVSNYEDKQNIYRTRDFVLPQVIHSSQNEPDRDYVLETVSFTDDSKEGYWH